ncbi:MAG TPA: TonB family protein [Acidobacteriota bacterium]|nr:TonB family protein [Acidobacteriota bacterium]
MADRKSTIGRFEIIEKIGEGPIGSVYKALDPVIRRTVAIKVIKLYALEETATFAEVFEKIYRVVRTSTSLNHPNICIIYDLSEEKKIPYITMEYVDGHDLDWMLQSKHQFKRAEVLNILQQTCDALDFAHKKQVIHQDLKSTNILLTPDLHVKITDFGIAGLDEIAAAQTKKLLSIPFYIAPEQALGEKVSPSSDLFSLGVIMYQILSGQLPFPGSSAANVIMMIARDNPVLPKHLDKSGIRSEDWNSFFSVALAKSPGQRFKTANEMFSALQKILPSSDTSYFPYHVDGGAADSTGRFENEKTFVGESPTLLIDPSKMLDETSAPADESPDVPPETISIPVPGTSEPRPSELTIAYNAGPESAYELLQASTPPTHEKAGTIQPSESAATMIVDSHPATTLPPQQQSYEAEVEESSAMAPTQMIPIPQLPKAESYDKPPHQTQSPSTIPPAPPVPPPLPAQPKQQTIPPVNRPAPPPPPPPTPPPQRYETYDANPLEEAELENVEMPATQMIAVPEPVMPATQMISMPPAAPPAKNPPTQPPTPTPFPKAPPELHSVPESPYSLPSSPKPAAAVAPPGAKSALKMYWIAAIAVALIIIVAGLIFLLPKITGPDKKEVDVTPQPKPPVVEPPPKKPEVEPPPAATVGRMIINSEPVGAKVLLNEEDKGVTPVDLPDLAFGKYILKLQSKGFQDYQQEVEITAEAPELTVGPITLEKAAPTTGTLFVDSNPAGAYIFIQNKALGVTPKTLGNQKPGDVEITLRKDGYRDFSGTAKITAGKKATLTATLEEIQKVVEKPPELPKPQAPQIAPGSLVNISDPDVTRPKTVKRVPAKYPEIAKKQKVEGSVMMNVLVTETGKIGDVKVVQSASPLLEQAAIDAVRQWVFEPATKKGVKVKVWLPIQLSFKYR